MNTREPFPDLNPPPPLSDEAAAQILQFLYHWIALFESRYYEDPAPDDPLDIFPDSDKAAFRGAGPSTSGGPIPNCTHRHQPVS